MATLIREEKTVYAFEGLVTTQASAEDVASYKKVARAKLRKFLKQQQEYRKKSEQKVKDVRFK